MLLRKRILHVLVLGGCAASLLQAQANISRSAGGWKLANGKIELTLAHAADQVLIVSLQRAGGKEWAAARTALTPFVDGSGEWRYRSDEITELPGGAKQLSLRFESTPSGVLTLMLRLYPTGAVIEFSAGVENRGSQVLPLIASIAPLNLTMASPAGHPLKPYSSTPDHHGFQAAGVLAGKRQFKDWLVLENGETGELALIGGDGGAGILDWRAETQSLASGTLVRAGNIFRNDQKDAPPSAYQIQPGAKIETPLAFLALAKGDPDDAGNEAFRYLKRYIFPEPAANAPLATYCVWLTDANVEETLSRELAFAKTVGFDVFYHDASWFEGSSIIPGMNDWSQGMGSYKENMQKFPHGLKALSDSVRSAGLHFGIWVDPGNVDAKRVESGEIPKDWLATIGGKELSVDHPSLSPTRQLCLGNPKVVESVKKQLSEIIDRWNIEWVKWDPSGTVSHACTRTDHGHGDRDGAFAAYAGRLEIMRFLLERYPKLMGFECDPSLRYTRTNPGPRELLPGGYTDEFISGPMLSPLVWGSLASAGIGDVHADHLTGKWYSASALDYHIRKHLTHGISYGNINGMTSQLLSAAPAGYIEAFKRNMIYFKRYRHLLFEDVYHPKLSAGAGWSATQYVREDAVESVVFVFRDKSEKSRTTIQLRALDGAAQYSVTSLNERPGRERVVSGAALMKEGVAASLPHPWLAKGDGLPGTEFQDQLGYGSDILMLRRLP